MSAPHYESHALDRVALEPFSALIFLAVFAAVAYATYRHAWWAICALIVTAPFALYRDLGPTELTLSKVTLVAAVTGLVASRASWRGWGSTSGLLFAGSLAIVFATALSIAQAAYRGPAIRETLKAAEYALTFAVVVVAMRREAYEIATRIAVAATSALVSLGALSDYLIGPKSGFWLNGHPIPRLAGPLEGPNQLAGYLTIVLSLQCAFILLRRPIPYERQAFFLGIGVLILTFSRSGILTFAVSVALLFALLPSARKRTTLYITLGGAVLGTAIAGLLSYVYAHDLSAYLRFTSLAEANHSEGAEGVGTRKFLWKAAIDMWRMHPIFGIGAGNFELEIPQSGPYVIRTHANSLYLQSLAEGGLPLLAAWLFTLSAAMWRFARGRMREPLVAGALAATVGISLHQIFDFLTFYPKVGTMFWIILALGAATIDNSAKPAAADLTDGAVAHS